MLVLMRLMLMCDVPLQTVKGGISETRIEKRIVITGDTEIDHDKVELDEVDLVKHLHLVVLVDVVDHLDLVDEVGLLLLLCPQLFLFHSDPPGSGSGHQGGQRAASRHVSDQGGGAPGDGDHSRVRG